MNKKLSNRTQGHCKISSDEQSLFREALGDMQPIKQDKIHFDKPTHKSNSMQRLKNESRRSQAEASFYFSDEFIPDLGSESTVNYVQEGHDTFLAKQLRRGDFYPDLMLDLHGLNKESVKLELAAFIDACKKQHIRCGCVVTGVGTRILQKKVPHYLAQHPDIIAMHQAPLEWGGKGALLILINSKQDKPEHNYI